MMHWGVVLCSLLSNLASAVLILQWLGSLRNYHSYNCFKPWHTCFTIKVCTGAVSPTLSERSVRWLKSLDSMETGSKSTKPVSAPIWWYRDFDEQPAPSSRKGPWSHSWLCWKPFGFRNVTVTSLEVFGPSVPSWSSGANHSPRAPHTSVFYSPLWQYLRFSTGVNVSAWACSRIYSVLPGLAVAGRAQAFAPVFCLYYIKVGQIVSLFIFVKKKILWRGFFTTILLPGVTLLLLGSHQAIHLEVAWGSMVFLQGRQKSWGISDYRAS